MNEKQERIKALMLSGHTREQIAQKCPDLKEGSIRVYIAEVKRVLTPDQIAAYDKAQVRVSRAFATDRPISTAHWHIGQRLARFRIEARMNAKAFCAKYPITNQVTLTKFEGGTHDFKLSELQKISEILSVSVDEMSQPMGGPPRNAARRKVILQPGSDPPPAAEGRPSP